MKTKKYSITDRETNNWIVDDFSTLKEAEMELEAMEEADKANNYYSPDYYEIINYKK